MQERFSAYLTRRYAEERKEMEKQVYYISSVEMNEYYVRAYSEEEAIEAYYNGYAGFVGMISQVNPVEIINKESEE